MRILHVVTLITPDGAYGGPVTVAVNQAQALLARGHEVVIAGAHSGFDKPPRELRGVPLQVFRARRVIPRTGFAGLTAPGLMTWAVHNIQSFDVVHVHMARDLVTLPLARLAQRLGVPTVLQTHGMIDPSERRAAQFLDRAITRRTLRGARQIFSLTPDEDDGLSRVGAPTERVKRLINGVPIKAPSGAQQREVLFLGRLQERKRPLHFAHSALALEASFPEWRFSLVGPDEGQGQELTQLLANAGSRVRWEGPIATEQAVERMARTSLFVLPSTEEPFPMAVLEAMSVGLPVIITNSCGLAPYIESYGAGIVVEPVQDHLTAAIRRFLEDPELLDRCCKAARALATEVFGMEMVTNGLVESYSIASRWVSDGN